MCDGIVIGVRICQRDTFFHGFNYPKFGYRQQFAGGSTWLNEGVADPGGSTVMSDSHFQSATISQHRVLVILDLCRVIQVVSWAPLQYVPVVWQMCSP